jgi:hypothetical protein
VSVASFAGAAIDSLHAPAFKPDRDLTIARRSRATTQNGCEERII